ncbi:MAG TPA: hypothetical protein DCE42_20705 [Myxococcales bacterium]|nr:hypothetical protein [Deltaproteobacteria bacterium]MBU50843.1 hypothetical protein [Deltaproteobacteria bacterium]HAA57199.1 hypothetical protein [Myxococcales bacterium]
MGSTMTQMSTNISHSPSSSLRYVFALLVLPFLFHCSPQHTDEPSTESERLSPDANTDTVPERTHISSVGQSCTQQSCPSPLTCEMQVPTGYCTKPCTQSSDCPAKSTCAKIRFKNGLEFVRCVATCVYPTDCREGFYCYHPPKAWKQICMPKLE